MTARRLTWLLAALLAIPLLVLSVAGLVAGTEAGTRWLLDVARPRLPAALDIGNVRGTLLAGVTVDVVRWQDDRVTVVARPVTVDLDLLPLVDREVRLHRLVVGTADVVVEPSTGEEQDGEVRIDLPVTIEIDEFETGAVTVTTNDVERRIEHATASAGMSGTLLRIRRFDLSSDWLDLGIAGTLRVGGRFAADLAVDWSLAAAGERWSGHLDAAGNTSSYSITHRLSSPHDVRSAGSIEFDQGAPRVDLRHTWDNLSRTIAGRDVALADGVLVTRGTRQELQLELDTSGSLEPLDTATISLAGSTDLQSLEIDFMRLESNLGDAEASGTVSWTDMPSLQLAASVRNVDVARYVPRFSGTIGADGVLQMEWPEGTVRGSIAIAALTGEVDGRSLGGAGDVRIDGSVIHVDTADVSLGASRITGSGRIADNLDLEARLDLRALGELDARAGGALSGDLAVSGPRSSPAVTANLLIDGPSWSGVEANSATVDLRRTAAGAIDANASIAGLRRGSVSVSETVVRVNGTTGRHSLALTTRNDGAGLELALDGSLADENWRGTLKRFDVDTGVLGPWSLRDEVDLAASAGSASVSSLCIESGNGGYACLEGDWGNEEGRLDVDIRQLPIAALPVTLPAGAYATGSVEADVSAELVDGILNAGGTFRLADAIVHAVYEDEPYEIAVTEASVNAQVVDNRLGSEWIVNIDDGAGNARASLDVDDLLRRDSPIGGSASLSVPDAAFFGVLLPDISGLTGSASGSLDLSGTLAAPSFGGEILLRDAAFDVRQAGIRITDMNLNLGQRAPGQLNLEGTAKSGGGEIRITGLTTVGIESGLRAELGISGTNFQLVRLPDWDVAASPDIRIVLDDEMAAVTGRLAIPSADITVRTLPETAVRPSDDVTVHGEARPEPERRRRIDVDIDTSLGDDVHLSGFGLSTGIEGSVRIRGGTLRPYTGAGTLALVGGRFEAYGQELEIESGDLIFNGPLENPQLNVRAIRRIDAESVTVGIRVAGTPRQLRSELFSDPPMSNAETLAYLLTGRPLSAPGADEDADLMNKAAFALGLSQAGAIASQISGELGLDTLSIEGGSESGRIVAGKRFGDRLLVEYGYGFIDKLGTLLLRYQLSNRLVLESRAGTVSEVDLVYNVRKK